MKIGSKNITSCETSGGGVVKDYYIVSCDSKTLYENIFKPVFKVELIFSTHDLDEDWYTFFVKRS